MSETKEYWVICGDMQYYPWVEYYVDKKIAEKAFNNKKPCDENVILAKVLQHKKSGKQESIDDMAMSRRAYEERIMARLKEASKRNP